MNGILVIDKPKGITSHDVVNFIRRRFKIKKVGHAGSLDPIATGVLILLLGDATKLSNQLMNSDKIYEAALRCGITTDTLDAEGKIKEKKDTAALSSAKIEKAFSKFRGESLQTPPYFSAVKHKGLPLYKLARRGISIKKEPRRINIEELTVNEIKMPDVSFRVHCSKGTYIRQLCGDIGDELGCGAHMIALRRVRSGDFKIEDAVSLDELAHIEPVRLENKIFQKQ